MKVENNRQDSFRSVESSDDGWRSLLRTVKNPDNWSPDGWRAVFSTCQKLSRLLISLIVHVSFSG